MAEQRVDACLLSVGPDLPVADRLRGHAARAAHHARGAPRRRGHAGGPRPRGAPGRRAPDDVFRIRPWGETDDPVAIVAELLGAARTARHRRPHLGPVPRRPSSGRGPRRRFATTSEVIGPLRAVKDAARDRRPAPGRRRRRPRSPPSCRPGEIPLVGRTEAEVSADLGPAHPGRGPPAGELRHRRRGRERGQPPPRAAARASSPPARSCCATSAAPCSPRAAPATAPTSPAAWSPASRPPRCAEVYAVLARGPGRRGRRRPRSAPRARRSTPPPATSSPTPGYGECFMHRTGHGIGVEEHEDPYIVDGNRRAARRRATPSRVEPGIYLPGRFGLPPRGHRRGDRRTAPTPLNRADHRLVAVDA